jgi:hypothetical protein
MRPKHTSASDYDPSEVDRVRAVCLTMATALGDLRDELVIVGGLVPSLLIDQSTIQSNDDRHVGTTDLDVGLALSLLDDKRYQTFSERLRACGFEPSKNEHGRTSLQSWEIGGPSRVTVDFLMDPLPGDRGGGLRRLEHDFAAFTMPGLHLAFMDKVQVRLAGRTSTGALAERPVWVAGPGAFVILKALALGKRHSPKDAYDLCYVLRHSSAGFADIARRIRPYLDEPVVREALETLRRDFATHESLGPHRVAMFLKKQADDDLQADARGLVLDLLDLLGPA